MKVLVIIAEFYDQGTFIKNQSNLIYSIMQLCAKIL